LCQVHVIGLFENYLKSKGYGHYEISNFSKKDFEYFDYIIGMDESNLADLRQMCPQDQQYKIQPFASESVPDPWYTGDFEETYDRVLTGCQAWLSRLENESEHGKFKKTL